jgi:hypothetical protein
VVQSRSSVGGMREGNREGTVSIIKKQIIQICRPKLVRDAGLKSLQKSLSSILKVVSEKRRSLLSFSILVLG